MKFAITVRPWEASGGSTVHDELVRIEAETTREALLKFYADEEYNFTVFRVIDIHWGGAQEGKRMSELEHADLKAGILAILDKVRSIEQKQAENHRCVEEQFEAMARNILALSTEFRRCAMQAGWQGVKHKAAKRSRK